MLSPVTKKQNNSRQCFVCGLENDYGLKASFFETEAGVLVATVHPREGHQSYPGRMHGGVIAALLDETIGRAIAMGREDEVWGVTIELSLKYRKPVPLDGAFKVVGRVTKDKGRIFEGSGEIILDDGSVAVEATGRYMKVGIDKITDMSFAAEDWFLNEDDSDPKALDLPGH